MNICENGDLGNIIGAGGYGVVVYPSHKKEALKLFYDLSACDKIKNEFYIQQKAYKIFLTELPEVGIPEVTYLGNDTVKFMDDTYLCGIGMTYLPPPPGFDEAVHVILGYEDDDIDTSWGKTTSLPVSPTNPTRGFFASKDTMEELWAIEGVDMSVEKMAYLMGKSMRLLLNYGIIPVDLEFIWSSGKPYIIDFGLCELGTIEPDDFLKLTDTRGLASDLYVPHEGQEGYGSFMLGFQKAGDFVL